MTATNDTALKVLDALKFALRKNADHDYKLFSRSAYDRLALSTSMLQRRIMKGEFHQASNPTERQP